MKLRPAASDESSEILQVLDAEGDAPEWPWVLAVCNRRVDLSGLAGCTFPVECDERPQFRIAPFTGLASGLDLLDRGAFTGAYTPCDL